MSDNRFRVCIGHSGHPFSVYCVTEINITVVQAKQEMMSVTNNSDVVVEVSRLKVLPQFFSIGCLNLIF